MSINIDNLIKVIEIIKEKEDQIIVGMFYDARFERGDRTRELKSLSAWVLYILDRDYPVTRIDYLTYEHGERLKELLGIHNTTDIYNIFYRSELCLSLGYIKQLIKERVPRTELIKYIDRI